MGVLAGDVVGIDLCCLGFTGWMMLGTHLFYNYEVFDVMHCGVGG